MKSAPRVLIIARNFWPAINDATLRLYHWIFDLRKQGVEPAVLTTRPQKSWAAKIYLDQIPVTRLDAPKSALRQFRFNHQMVDWIQSRSDLFDLLYFDHPSQEALSVATKMASDDLRLAVRMDELHGEASHWPKGTRDLLRRADAILVPTDQAHRQVRSAGVIDTTIVRSPDRPLTGINRSIGARRQARQVLAEANHDLFARATDQIVVCPISECSSAQLEQLIPVLAGVALQNRSLRIWLVGTLKDEGRIYDQLRHEGAHHCVLIPGVFTDWEPIWQAADLVLVPTERDGVHWLAPTCLANAIPMLAHRSATFESIVSSHAEAMLLDIMDRVAVADALHKWLADPSDLQHAALACQQRLVNFPPAANVLPLLSWLTQTDSANAPIA